VDATSIALDTIGKPIFNTTMLGALAKFTHIISIDALNWAIEEELSNYPEELIEANKTAVRKCYEVAE
jgi:pyruvate ferredoxin oxidoreductase gamma subunit